MKKFVAVFLSLVVLMLCVAGAVSAATGDKFAFGGEDPVAGQDGSAQGQNGWYYMWSPEFNKAGDLDVSKIKESIASDYGSAWFAYGGGLYVDGTKGWIPEIYSDEEVYDDLWNNWWLQGPDGSNVPAVTTEDMYATAVIGFKAPSDGFYSFDMVANAGNKDLTDDSCDGVTVSINTASGKLFSKELSGAVAEHEASVKMMLKKDEFVYFAVDPNANGGNDDAVLAIEGEIVGKYIDVDNVKTFLFGGVEGTFYQDGSAQGQNGWYYMWSPEYNKAGSLDLSKIKECIASDYGSAWFAYGGGLYVGGTKGWIPDIYSDEEVYDDLWNNWWLQGPDGSNVPAVVTEDMYATAIIGFKAPKAGEYTFDLTANVGNGDTSDDSCDGVFLSVNTAAGVLYAQDADSEVQEYAKSVTVTLDAGEFIYFVVDPKINGGNDKADFQIFGTLVKETIATTTVVGGETTTTAAGGEATTTVVDGESNPGTGSVMPYAIVVIGLSAVMLLLGSRKRKNIHENV